MTTTHDVIEAIVQIEARHCDLILADYQAENVDVIKCLEFIGSGPYQPSKPTVIALVAAEFYPLSKLIH